MPGDLMNGDGLLACPNKADLTRRRVDYEKWWDNKDKKIHKLCYFGIRHVARLRRTAEF